MAWQFIDWLSCCIKPGAADASQPDAADASQPGANDSLKCCQGIIEKSDDLIMKIGRGSQEYLMNEEQCRFLVKRLSGTLADIPCPSHPDDRPKLMVMSGGQETSLVFQELRYVFEDAHRLIQSCCIKSTASNSERLRAAIEQGDMKHTFAKLLYDVRWHADVLQSILEDSGGPRTTFEAARCIINLSDEDNTALMNAKEEDDKVLTDRLRSLKLDREYDRDIADQLLRQRGVHAQLNEDLGHRVLLLREEEMKEHLDGNQIGKGAFGEVRETNLLGGRHAVKIISQSRSDEMEVKAMQGLGHHPNIVRLYCYSRINDECFLIMERMDNDLACILRYKKRIRIEVSLVEKVSLMLEIAEGIWYIHSMHMAHRDLKPSNVLLNLEDPKKNSSRAYSVKIADFGLTKTKDASRTYKDQTPNTGTPRYMAPEVIAFESNEKLELNPTKADVYSYGIICFEILTGQTAFGEIENKAIRKGVKTNGDFRPDLQQGHGPPRLKSLIQRCWAPHHHSRPDFDRICPELRYIKGLILRADHQMLQTELNFTSELESSEIESSELESSEIESSELESSEIESSELESSEIESSELESRDMTYKDSHLFYHDSSVLTILEECRLMTTFKIRTKATERQLDCIKSHFTGLIWERHHEDVINISVYTDRGFSHTHLLNVWRRFDETVFFGRLSDC